MPSAVTNSYHIKTLYPALTLITLYKKREGITVFPTYTAQGNSEHKLQQNGSWQTTPPLSSKKCFRSAPYCLASLITSMHNTKKAYLWHITLLQWYKELAKVLCVGHVYTTFTTQFWTTSSADEIVEMPTQEILLHTTVKSNINHRCLFSKLADQMCAYNCGVLIFMGH